MVCQQVRKYHFKQSVSCISLLSVIVLGGIFSGLNGQQ